MHLRDPWAYPVGFIALFEVAHCIYQPVAVWIYVQKLGCIRDCVEFTLDSR